MSSERRMVFCATQRTGSAVIFDDLFNLMGSWPADAEKPYTLIFRDKTHDTWASVWDKVREKNRVGDIVAVKVMFHYTPYLSDFMNGAMPPRRPPVLTFEPHRFDAFYDFFRDAIWVHIQRNDVCAQAVSMYFAESVNIWENRKGPTEGSAEGGKDLPYDRERLMQYARGFLTERAQWQRFFSHYGISPLRIVYEDAANNYPAYLDELISVAGLTPITPPRARRMFKVGTARNAELAEMLREDLRAELGGAWQATR